ASDSDICVVRNGLGKAPLHPSEHRVGCLLLHLPVLVTGPFSLPEGLPRDKHIRYIDCRQPPEKLRYVPKSTGRPCLSLRTTYAEAYPMIFLDPSDVAIACSISGCAEDGVVTEDSPETSVYKYLSMSFRQGPDKDGLLAAVSSAFGSSVDMEREEGPPEFGEGDGILSGEGLYAAKWLSALLAAPSRIVWIETPCIPTALAIVDHASKLSGASYLFRRHSDEFAAPDKNAKNDWQVVDAS
ncbi:hypothetical protein KIPB_016107, partial [Kipferlia bialata]